MILACGHPLPVVASSDLEMHYAFASHSRVAGICRACLRLVTATRFESDVRIQRHSACFLKIAKCPRIAIALMQLGVNSKESILETHRQLRMMCTWALGVECLGTMAHEMRYNIKIEIAAITFQNKYSVLISASSCVLAAVSEETRAR